LAEKSAIEVYEDDNKLLLKAISLEETDKKDSA
jgi:hypothetical protein